MSIIQKKISITETYNNKYISLVMLVTSWVIGCCICFNFIKLGIVLNYEKSMFCLLTILIGVLIYQLYDKKQSTVMSPKKTTEPVINIASLLDFIPNAILVVDEQGKIVSNNKKALSIFAYTNAEELKETNNIDIFKNNVLLNTVSNMR